MSEPDSVAALLASAADSIDPGPAPITRIVTRSRRRTRRARLAAAAGLTTIVAAAFLGLWAAGRSPAVLGSAGPRAVRPDDAVITAVSDWGAQNHDRHPSRIRYVTTSAKRAQTYLDAGEDLGLGTANKVVVAVATGHFVLAHTPSARNHVTARFASVVLDAADGRLLGSGLGGAAGDLSTLGDVTDCRMSYRAGHATSRCHRS